MKNNIKNLLKEKEISILKLSEGIGLTYAATHALINRKDLGTTQFENLRNIATFLEVEMSELYEEDK